MAEHVHGIVLRIVRYSDNASIATAWTREQGRMSILVPSGNTREAQRRRAIMMPMGVFEGVLLGNPTSEVRKLRDVSPLQMSPAATGHPVRTVVAMFLAECLYALLKESQADERLSDFLLESMAQLNVSEGTALANFHLWFLYHLGHFLGIEPDNGTYQRGFFFDMKEARYVAALPLHPMHLQPREARIANVLGRVQWRHLSQIRFNRQQRNAALDTITAYYGLHHADITKLPTMEIIHQIFD